MSLGWCRANWGETSALRHLPVAMLIVSDRDEDIVKSYGHGACSYICKPLDFGAMKDFIKNFELYWTRVSKIPAPRRS